ncbi:glutathione S-transferase family protein [Sesbania bispinosa]|nr:glutathione S-transferase family protein [Sesbania bispinosa]
MSSLGQGSGSRIGNAINLWSIHLASYVRFLFTPGNEITYSGDGHVMFGFFILLDRSPSINEKPKLNDIMSLEGVNGAASIDGFVQPTFASRFKVLMRYKHIVLIIEFRPWLASLTTRSFLKTRWPL